MDIQGDIWKKIKKQGKYYDLKWNYLSLTLKTSYVRKRGFLMFLDNLSASLLQLCETQQLSYERAAELCGCSSRHFGNIVRKTAAPSLIVFERICSGFGLTPNQLLGVAAVPQKKDFPFRTPMPVTKIVILGREQKTSFPVCPRCGITLEREFQSYCDRCGQCLSWRRLNCASVTRYP